MKCIFSNTAKCHIFFVKRRFFFAQTPKTIKQIIFSPKKTSKRSAATIGCSFEKIDIKFTPKIQYFCSTTKKLEQSLFIPKKRPKIVPLNTLKVVLTILRVFFLYLFKIFCSESESDLKKRFIYKLFPPFFSVLVGCFLDTLTFFVKRWTKVLKLQNRWVKKTFLKKKITFPQQMPPDARIAVETDWEKIYRPSVFWIKLQRSVEEYKKFQICFFTLKLPWT